MQGVAGGVRPRQLANGQAQVTDPDLLSASTTLQQSGGGGYARLVDALQSLDQTANILQLLSGLTDIAAQIATINTHLTTIDSQITSINGQIGTLNTQMSQVQTAIVSINGQIGTINGEITTINNRLAAAGIP